MTIFLPNQYANIFYLISDIFEYSGFLQHLINVSIGKKIVAVYSAKEKFSIHSVPLKKKIKHTIVTPQR